MFCSKRVEMFTLGALTIASGDSDCRKTDSLKATRGGDTCSWMRAKRSFKSLITVSRCTSPAHQAVAVCEDQGWTKKLTGGGEGGGGGGAAIPPCKPKHAIDGINITLSSV